MTQTLKEHLPDAGTLSKPTSKKWTREEYYRLNDEGFFGDGRFELIEGRIYQMPPQRETHSLALEFVDTYLRKAFPKGFRIRAQSPFRASGNSEPEPDFAIIAGKPVRGNAVRPSQANLVIEVSESTIRHDRRKARVYAASGIQEYWILNLVTNSLEVHRDPISEARAKGSYYADMHIYSAGDAVAPLANPSASVKVADLLP